MSGGYPEKYEKYHTFVGLETVTDSKVFHAGAVFNNGEIVTSGGRVLALTSLSEDYKDAFSMSYENISKIFSLIRSL